MLREEDMTTALAVFFTLIEALAFILVIGVPSFLGALLLYTLLRRL